MKMPDGGFRPAYNMQIASVAGEQITVAVEVSTSGSDRGLARPMLEEIEASYGALPAQHLIDGGFNRTMTSNRRIVPRRDALSANRAGSNILQVAQNRSAPHREGQRSR